MNLVELYRLRLADGIEAGDISPMMVFPIGQWHSAKYPELPLTEQLADELIANFEAGVLGTEPVVDSSGKHDTSAPAAGWVKRLYLAGYEGGGEDGLALWADVKWTALGAELLSDERYKYGSVEIGSVVMNDSGETVDNVLRSLTLTNTPVLRVMPGVQDAAARRGDPLTLSLAEFVMDDSGEDDPMASLLADLEAVLDKASATLKGKPGVRAVRTYLRETLAKAGAVKLAEPGSVEERRRLLQEAVAAAFPQPGGEEPLIEDFGPDWLIWSTWSGGEPRYWRCPYEATDQGITLGQPVEVKRETTYVPVSDGAPGAALPSDSQAIAMGEAGEGAGAATVEDHAARKGVERRMNEKALSILQLAEDASEEAQSAAVLALAEERDDLQRQLDERDKAERTREFEAKLAEAMKPDEQQLVHILPGEREVYLALAEVDHARALAAIEARMQGPGLKLGAVGSPAEGDSDQERPADVVLAEMAALLSAKDGIDIVTAQDRVLAEHPELKTRLFAAEQEVR